MLSCHRETALQDALVLAKSGRLDWETIFYGHYRSIFNHYDSRPAKLSNSVKKNSK